MIIVLNGKAGSGKSEVASYLVNRHHFVEIAFADAMKRVIRDIYGFDPGDLWGPSEQRGRPYERFEHWRYEETCQICGVTYDCSGPPPPETEDACGHAGMREAWNEFRAGESSRVEYLTPRYALQTLGDWGRRCYANTWVDLTFKLIERMKTGAYLYDPFEGLVAVPPLADNGEPPTNFVIPDQRFRNEFDRSRQEGAKLVRIFRPGAGLKGMAAGHVSETEQDGIADEEFDLFVKNDSTLEVMFEKLETTLMFGAWK